MSTCHKVEMNILENYEDFKQLTCTVYGSNEYLKAYTYTHCCMQLYTKPEKKKKRHGP